MILGQNIYSFIFKLDMCGDGGGDGPGGEADPGAIGGETIGEGQMGGQGGSGGSAGSSDAGPLGGQGTLSGILSGGREGMDAIAAQEGMNAVAAAANEAGASSVDSGDPTSGGFGGTVVGGSVGEGDQSIGESAALGTAIGEAVATGNMTVGEANAALGLIGDQNSGLAGIIGEAAANTMAAMSSIPGELSTGLATIAPTGALTGLIGLGGLASAVSGQGMLGGEPDPVGAGIDGPDMEDPVYSGLGKLGIGIEDINKYITDNSDKTQTIAVPQNSETLVQENKEKEIGILSAPQFKRI